MTKKIIKNPIKLKVRYGGGFNEAFDREIKKVVEKYNWLFEGSGYDLQTNERDLSFFRKNEKENK